MSCPDNLLAGFRRGTLSEREARELDLHLERCATCRLALRLGQDFDRGVSTLPGDELIAARIAAAVLARAAPGDAREQAAPTEAPRRRRGGRVALLAAAATLLLASGALAAARLGALPFLSADPPPAPAFPPPGPAPRVPAPTTEPEPLEDTPVEESPAAEATPADDEATTARAPRPPPSAEALFTEANTRRREGDTRRATALYRQLQRTHPRSSEALVSHVSLGRMLLDRGDGRGALEQFDRYLARAPRGPLAEEALFGKASALARLHRVAEERRTWEALLEAYPRSIYRERASARLAPSAP